MPRGRRSAQSQTGEREERLLIESAQRDPARFAELYEVYCDRVYAYVERRVEIRAEAEDLVSDVFHHALANLRRYEWRGSPFSAWLFRIAANKIADRWERLGRERAMERLPETEAADQEEAQIGQRFLRWCGNCPKTSARFWSCVSWRRKARAKLRKRWGAAKGRSNNCSFAAWRTCGRG